MSLYSNPSTFSIVALRLSSNFSKSISLTLLLKVSINFAPLTSTSAGEFVEETVGEDVPDTVTEEEIIEEIGLEPSDFEEVSTPSAEVEDNFTPSTDSATTDI